MFLARFFIILVFFGALIFLPSLVSAETSIYRAAGWVETDGDVFYNTDGCRASDGIYCSRPNAIGGANLYFSSFGTLADFGIPSNSTINKVHVRIKGKNNDNQRIYLDRGKNKKPLSQLCQNPFDLWVFFLGGTDTTREFHTSFTPFSTGGNNLANCFTTETIDGQNYTFSIYDVESFPWSASIDNFEVGFDYIPVPSLTATHAPSLTPTITQTPTPTALPTPAPFLDLPWD
jgi:hypothetical protein